MKILLSLTAQSLLLREKTVTIPDPLRAFLDSRGDSLVFVEDDEIIKVHVHTDHPGLAIEQALKYGSLLTVK